VLFPGFERGGVDFDADPGPAYRAGERYTDNWGCVWYNVQDGLEGQCVGHPLEDWDALGGYRFPDPMALAEREPWDWPAIEKATKEARERGELTVGWGERLFDRLYFLRGWEMLTEHELALVNKWLEIGVDIISFHTDIGTQKALMISPADFRKYLKPMFASIFQTCRKAGTHVFLSSDGYMLDIVDDLVECGVSVHDPQIRANTVEGIVRAYKGKLCADVDLDEQMFARCTPDDIRRQVEEVVEHMGSVKGGLMLTGLIMEADVPLENIEALCAALEKVYRSSALMRQMRG
jgi:uroporphyrinogen decarboxylase